MAPPLVSLYHALTGAAPWLLRQMARRAHHSQKAPPARLQERFGKATKPRPDGPLIWLHAASVGEVQSTAALVPLLAAHGTVLVTTTTTTGAARADKVLPEALHQYAPTDTADAVKQFLEHWRPDLALFVEADVWPRMSAALSQEAMPAALLNARASRSRQKHPQIARHLLAPFKLITCQSEAIREGLAALALEATLGTPGDLKADLPAPAPAPDALKSFEKAASGRPVWAAVSTHPADEPHVLAAHDALLKEHPDALLLWLPRHPERAAAIRAAAQVPLAQHSKGEAVSVETAILLQDTLGDATAAFTAAPLTYLGGGIGKEGGHNPYEPAKCGSYVLSGPKVANSAAAYELLQAAGYAETLAASALPAAVQKRIGAPHLPPYESEGNAARATMDLLEPLLKRR